MEVSTQVKKKIGKNFNLDVILNDKANRIKFFNYSIEDETGIGLSYELICYDSKTTEKPRKIGTLNINLIGIGERARIVVYLLENENDSGEKVLELKFKGPVNRYLNLENTIVLRSLEGKIYTICTKKPLEDQKRISLRILYENNQIRCEHTNEGYKKDIYELLTYIGCALKSREISELIYERLNPDECREIKKHTLNDKKESKKTINYIV